jgi:hypothetical protein
MKKIFLKMKKMIEEILRSKNEIIVEIIIQKAQKTMDETKTEMKNEINDLNLEIVDESDENHDKNENLENQNQGKIKSLNLKLHLRTVMNIFLKILKFEKLWVNNQDSLKSTLHF